MRNSMILQLFLPELALAYHARDQVLALTELHVLLHPNHGVHLVADGALRHAHLAVVVPVTLVL